MTGTSKRRVGRTPAASPLHEVQASVASTAELTSLLEGHTPEVAEIVQLLRARLRQSFEGAHEWADQADGLLAYGRSRRMADLAFAIVPHRAHVNLQLADGAELPDPAGIVEGTGKRIRHVKCRSRDDVARPELQALVDEQVRRRG